MKKIYFAILALFSFSFVSNGSAQSLPLVLVKADTTLPQQLLFRQTYLCSYNKDLRSCNWVSWYITRDQCKGNVKRYNMPYLEDEDTVIDRQRLSDWFGVKGYDHGHVCPAADYRSSAFDMRRTFYLSNMTVQKSELNRGLWKRIEDRCRSWTQRYDTLFIVSGPIYSPQSITVGNNLKVPDRFFKAVLGIRKHSPPTAIGFVVDNSKHNARNIYSHAFPIHYLESLTGLDFFSSLPDSLETAIESHLDITSW